MIKQKKVFILANIGPIILVHCYIDQAFLLTSVLHVISVCECYSVKWCSAENKYFHIGCLLEK